MPDRIRRIDIEWVALADALPPGEPPGLVDGIDAPGRTLVVRTAVAFIGRHGFAPFAWYRIAVGTAMLVLLLA